MRTEAPAIRTLLDLTLQVFPSVLWALLANYQTQGVGSWELQFIAVWPEVQVTTLHLHLESEVGTVLWDLALNLWVLMLTQVDMSALNLIVAHPAGIWEFLSVRRKNYTLGVKSVVVREYRKTFFPGNCLHGQSQSPAALATAQSPHHEIIWNCQAPP